MKKKTGTKETKPHLVNESHFFLFELKQKILTVAIIVCIKKKD
jgi:hypothetical protein